jgi:hypothetical protein
LAKVYGFLGTTQADITRAAPGDYTGTAYNQWNGGMLNNVPFFNNGVDDPQIWAPVSLAQKLVVLPNWPANTKAKVLRAFKSYMIALDVSAPGGRDRRMVKWSDEAGPGTVPSSWDPADPTKNAGELSLGEGTDGIIDCLTLGDVNAIYTEGTTWLQRLSGTSDVFYFNRVFDTVGILGQDCAAQFLGKHFVVTTEDVVVHDGATVKSVIDGRLRKWLFSVLSSTAYHLSRVVPFYEDREMWFFFTQSGGAVLNTVAIWNWFHDTWTIRDVPNIRAAASSLHPPFKPMDTWDVADGTWATWTGPWGDPTQPPFGEAVLFSPTSLAGVMRVGIDRQFAGANYRSYVERIGLVVAGNGPNGVVLDPGVVKLVAGVWPSIVAEDGTEIKVYLGSSMTPEGTITWVGPATYVVGSSLKVDLYTTGRFIAVRFEEADDKDWALQGYALDIISLGGL